MDSTLVVNLSLEIYQSTKDSSGGLTTFLTSAEITMWP
jgi:hypothetical protein